MSDPNKIMGIVPKDKYLYFAYMFLLVSAGGRALYALLGVIGLGMESATYGTIAIGLLAVALSAVGLTNHKADFTATEHAHFKYIITLFVAFFVINIAFGSVYALSYTLGYLCTAALGLVEAVLVWTGYNALQGGRTLTKDNIKSEVKIAMVKR